MNLPDLEALRQKGMEQAAIAWESIEQEQPPFDPINVFKACSSVKCAEMLTRLRHSSPGTFQAVVPIISEFLEGTLKDIGGTKTGNMEEGMRIVRKIEGLFPFKQEEFDDPSLFAIRQHTYDGVLILAASQFGAEQMIKQRIEDMQMEIAMHLLMAAIRKLASENEPS